MVALAVAWRSSAISLHLLVVASSKLSFQSMFFCHNSCINSLARMVIGDRKPSGAKILEEYCNIFLLVTVEFAVESIFFGMKLNLSSAVF